MKLSDIFGGSKLKLLETMIEEEAKEYKKNYAREENGDYPKKYAEITLSKEGLLWAEQLKQIIADEILVLCPNGFDWCFVSSYGNAGDMEYAITIYGKGEFWNYAESDIDITFCTCGNLSHWGKVSKREKEKIK